MDRKGGVLSLKKKKKILDFFLVLFTLDASRSETKIPLSGGSACPVKCEAYFTGGASSTFAQLGFKKRFRINTILIIESGCGIIWIFAKNTVLYNQTQKACRTL